MSASESDRPAEAPPCCDLDFMVAVSNYLNVRYPGRLMEPDTLAFLIESLQGIERYFERLPVRDG